MCVVVYVFRRWTTISLAAPRAKKNFSSSIILRQLTAIAPPREASITLDACSSHMMASREIRIGSLVSPPLSAYFSKEDECLSWLSEDIIVSPLPEASDVLLGIGPVDKWLSDAVVPFADDFTVLRDHHHHRKHRCFWLMTVNKAYSHAIMDALRVCDQRIICLQPRGDITALWKEEASIKKKKNEGPVKKPDACHSLVFWPSPHYVRTEERRSLFFGSADITPTLSSSDMSKVTVVLLGPMSDVSPAAVDRILKCVGVQTFMIGSIAVGDSHRAVAFSGKAAGWLLVARSPTILVDARMLG